MSEEKKSLNQIINFRIEKLSKLKELGFEPYPHKYDRTHRSVEILNGYKKLKNKDVSISGRVMALRKMGKASFIHVMDEIGQIQVFIKNDNVGEKTYEAFKLIDIGDFIGVSGVVFKTKTKEISINASILLFYQKALDRFQ